MNVQRKWIYERRLAALERPSIKDEVVELISEVLDILIDTHCPEKTYPEEWNLKALSEDLRQIYLLNLEYNPDDIESLTREKLKENLLGAVMGFYNTKEATYGEEVMRQLERYAVLSTIDQHWRDHLAEMEELRTGIGLRAYHGGMGKPIDIYKREAFKTFQEMIETVDKEIINLVYKLQIKEPEKSREERRRERQLVSSHADSAGMGMTAAPEPQLADGQRQKNPMAEASQAGKQDRTFRRQTKKVGRNDPCPCGSGKKYKKCHGKE
jgi:preprotein translocase subunit SecA